MLGKSRCARDDWSWCQPEIVEDLKALYKTYVARALRTNHA
jgi:hypothetical protein